MGSLMEKKTKFLFRSGEVGFSLVELMVAVAISVFLLLGISYIYVGSKQTFRNQEALARMQENARLAFEYLSQDLRMAGYFGCGSRYAAPPTGGYLECPGGEQIGKVVNTLLNPSNFSNDFRKAVSGYSGTESDKTDAPVTTGTTFDPDLPTGVPTANTDPKPLANSDVLVIRGTLSLGITVTDHAGGSPPGSADIKVNKSTGLAQGDIVVISDCQSAGIFAITQLNGTGNTNVVHNTGAATPGNACKELGKDYTGGEVSKAMNRTYFVAIDPSNKKRALFRQDISASPQVIVPGVEGFRVKYGWGATVEGFPGGYYTAKQIDEMGTGDCTNGGVSTGDPWDCVKSIKVDLLMVSEDASLATDSQRLWYNNAIYIPTDKSLRLAITTTIGIRNRMLLSAQ